MFDVRPCKLLSIALLSRVSKEKDGYTTTKNWVFFVCRILGYLKCGYIGQELKGRKSNSP